MCWLSQATTILIIWIVLGNALQGFLSTFSVLVAVFPSDMHKELLSRVPPGAAVGVSTTPSYKHVGHDKDTETITGSLLCLLLLYLLPCPWFCSTRLLSRRVKNQYFLLFWLHWLQGRTVRATGKGKAFLNYILANQRFTFSSLWTSLRTQKGRKKETFLFLFYFILFS